MEASARKKKRPLAAIPENLEELSVPVLSNQIVVAVDFCAQVEARAHQDNKIIAAASAKEAQGR